MTGPTMRRLSTALAAAFILAALPGVSWAATPERRVAHTAHHRGQQMALLRMLGRDLHSNYGPTADTGGLMANGAPVIYAHRTEEQILSDAPKASLPGPGEKPPTERP